MQQFLQFIILTFICSSTCFGRPHTHHQELNNCSCDSCAVGRGQAVKRPDHDQQHCYHHTPKIKPEAATAVVELMMMGVKTPETCWAVNKRHDNKLEKFLHLVG